MSLSEAGPPKQPKSREDLLKEIFEENRTLAVEIDSIDKELAGRADVHRIHGSEEHGTKQRREFLLNRRTEIIDRIAKLREMTEVLMQSGDQDIRA